MAVEVRNRREEKRREEKRREENISSWSDVGKSI
jgi:hypothetical protein